MMLMCLHSGCGRMRPPSRERTEDQQLLTCHTPTMALAIRMSRMTKGSTKAVMVSSPSSNQARTCRQHKTQYVHYVNGLSTLLPFPVVPRVYCWYSHVVLDRDSTQPTVEAVTFNVTISCTCENNPLSCCDRDSFAFDNSFRFSACFHTGHTLCPPDTQ